MNAPLSPVSVTVRPTGIGRALLVVTIAAFVAAWGGAGAAGSAFAVLGSAVFLVAAASTWRHASSLRVAAPAPVTAFAHERFVLDVPIANLARHAGAFDVLLSTRGPEHGDLRIGAMLSRLRAGAWTRIEVACPLLRRGLHRQGTLELSSSFPLGLWTCRLRFELPEKILVLPRIGTLRRVDSGGRRLRGNSGHGGAGRGDEQEIYGVRAWRDGEGLRSVHWKLSARRGRLLAREFRSEPRPRVHVILETMLDADSRRARSAFEEAVSLAATLVDHETRAGRAVRLTLSGREPRTVACRRGAGAVHPVLRALALVVPEVRDVADVDSPMRAKPGEKTYVVRVARGPANAFAAPRRRTDADVVVFDVNERGLASVFDRRRRPGHQLLLGVRS